MARFDVDFLGNEINIGDKVIFEAPKYRDFVIGTVISKAEKTCQIEYINNWNYPTVGREMVFRQYYGQLIKYADVAPRAEVAREICCKIEEEIVAALESNYRARKEHIERYAELAYDTELLLEINGKINALRGIEGFVEELKKKYAEGEK